LATTGGRKFWPVSKPASTVADGAKQTFCEWPLVAQSVSDDPDFEYLIVDSTIVRAHQHAAGARKGGLKIKRSAARAEA